MLTSVILRTTTATAATVLSNQQRRAASTMLSWSQLVTTPSKVAQALDWRMTSGSLLSVVVQTNSLQIAVASHPVFHEEAKELPSISLVSAASSSSSNGTRRSHNSNRNSSSSKTTTTDSGTTTIHNSNISSNDVTEILQRIVNRYNVCGIVVAWPVQHDGWIGASCGRVLHALDHIPVTSRSLHRPVCLYDAAHTALPKVDEWGRCALYSTVSTTSEAALRGEQPYLPTPPPTAPVASQVCRDFMHDHWPELTADATMTTTTLSALSHAASWCNGSSNITPFVRSPQQQQKQQHLVGNPSDRAQQHMAYF